MHAKFCAVVLSVFVLNLGAFAGTVAGQYEILARPGARFILAKDGDAFLTAYPVVFEPGWAWIGDSGADVEEVRGGVSCEMRYEAQKTSAVMTYGCRAGLNRDGDPEIALTLSTDADMPLTYAGFAFEPQSLLDGGKLLVTHADGETETVGIPLAPKMAPNVKRLTFVSTRGEQLSIRPKTPRTVHIDGDSRIRLVDDILKADETVENTVTLHAASGWEFFKGAEEAPDVPDIDRWFPFRPENDTGPSAIGMRHWLSKPAGRGGFLKIEGNRLVTPDGTPIKLWGTNVEYADNAPEAEVARRRAQWFAKYGINAVRLHKLTNPGWEGMGTTESAATYDPEKLARFDYFTSEMRKNGLYYGLSPIWDLQVFPGDRDRLLAYDELAAYGEKPNTVGVLWFSEAAQDLHIETMLNLLNHRNPHTGLRYAEDTAVAYIEMQNEDDAFWYANMTKLLECPSYRKLAAEKFSKWLRRKYGDHEGLVEAWGAPALNAFTECYEDEHLDKGNIFPVGNPWFYVNTTPETHRRLMDTARFLYDCQNAYYDRMAAAIREAGYGGPLVSSCWQAGEGVSHYYNLHSDARIGIVDRHNYMGGTGSWAMNDGMSFRNVTMLTDPGSGLLSTGMQQVAGRPFSVSEWMSVSPTEWQPAAAPIMGAYGMGLQGWDMSYFFASNAAGFTETLHFPGPKTFNNQTPTLIGIFPALSRMVRRGDVYEARVISRRPVHVPSLLEGEPGFTDRVAQSGDMKSFGGDVPQSALAVGRVLVDFTESPEPFEPVNLEPYREGETLVSTTGQLRWTASGAERDGHVTINTPGTKGVVGFTGDESFALGNVTITPGEGFGVLFVSAAGRDETVTDDDRLLITVCARSRNTGMRLYAGHILKVGHAPIILEPVKARVTIDRPGTPTVYILDHDGRRTSRTVPVRNGTIEIDTARDKALYYEVVYP